jgi:hypothetical protein
VRAPPVAASARPPVPLGVSDSRSRDHGSAYTVFGAAAVNRRSRTRTEPGGSLATCRPV